MCYSCTISAHSILCQRLEIAIGCTGGGGVTAQRPVRSRQFEDGLARLLSHRDKAAVVLDRSKGVLVLLR